MCPENEDYFLYMPKNAEIKLTLPRKHRNMAQEQLKNHFLRPAFGIGILPTKYIKLERSQPTSQTAHTINPTHVNFNSGIFYGDASGDECKRHALLRKARCELVRTTATGSVIFGADF